MSEDITNSSESQLRKFLQEWWALITLISTSMAGLFTGLFSEGVARSIGFVLSLLMIGLAIYIWMRQERKRKEKKQIEDRVQGYKTANEKSSFRGLYSFKEGDSLPGSDRQRQAKLIYTQIIDPSFSFGIICGESGCGKSSILNAGVVSKLKASGKNVTLIEKDKNLLKEDLKKYLDKIMQRLSFKTDQETSFLIIDQFEEFLITWQETEERQSIGNFFYELSNSNVKVLLILRKDFLADINDFEPDFPNPVSSKNIFYIKNFTATEAKEIIEVCAKRDGLSPTDDFIEVLVRDLTNDGLIRPVQLQIVCTALLTSFDLNSYRIGGGVNGILSSYVKDSINLCSNPEVAKKILRSLCDFSAKAKAEPKTISKIKEEIGDSVSDSIIENSLKTLEASRVIVIVNDDGIKKIKILHDYLVESISIATSSIATNQERANQLVKYYIHNFQDNDSINTKDIQFIITNANKLLLGDPRFKKLVKLNKIRAIKSTATYSLPIIILTTILLAFLTQKNYWKDEILDYALKKNQLISSTTIFIEQNYVMMESSSDAYVWDIETGKRLLTFKKGEYKKLSANLILVWNYSNSTLYLYDLARREKIKMPNTISAHDVLESDGNDNIIAFRKKKDSVVLWSIREHKIISSFSCIPISSAHFDPSINRVFIECVKEEHNYRSNRGVGAWDIETGKFIKLMISSDTLFSLESHVLLAKKTNGIFTLEEGINKRALISWDIALNKIKEIPFNRFDFYEARFSKDENYIIIEGRDFFIINPTINTKAPEIYHTTNLTLHNEIVGTKKSAVVGNYILFNKQDSSKTYLLNIDKDYPNELDFNISSVASDPVIHGDSLLIFLDLENNVQIWNYKKKSKTILEKIPDAISLSLTVDGKMLQINQLGNRVVIVDLSRKEIFATLSNIGWHWCEIYYNTKCNYFLVWSGDGRLLKFSKTMSIFGKEFVSTDCKN
jgi:hypothetical protein